MENNKSNSKYNRRIKKEWSHITNKNQRKSKYYYNSDITWVSVKKDLNAFLSKGEIDAKVDSSQIIKGTIKLNDEGNILDKSKSKFILNTNKSSILGEESYTKGSSIETQTQGIQND